MSENLEFTKVNPDGSKSVRIVPVGAIAAWGELLGLTDPSEILTAIFYVQDNGEPPMDPETGRTVWSNVYEAIAAKEQARKSAIVNLQKVGEDGIVVVSEATLKMAGDRAANSMQPEVEAAQQETREALLPSDLKNAIPMFPMAASAFDADREAFTQTVIDTFTT